jgi:hypothetical protein
MATEGRIDVISDRELLREAADALMRLLDDTQHKEHEDCEDGGYCPVRDARQTLAKLQAAMTTEGPRLQGFSMTDEKIISLARLHTVRNGSHEWCNYIDFARAVIAFGQTGPVEVDRDTDGDLLIDWSPGKGRLLSMSLGADGRLSYAFTWDGEKAHGTAQMPAGGYWLCCGSRDPSHQDERGCRCLEAESGHSERCRFGTAVEHSEWQRRSVRNATAGR